jgi:hypothetical protein
MRVEVSAVGRDGSGRLSFMRRRREDRKAVSDTSIPNPGKAESWLHIEPEIGAD